MQPSWTDVGVFWITIGVGLVTAAATAINYFLYRSQVSPEVVVYVVADDRRPSIINLVIENIGKGVAKKVRFSLSEPLPGNAFGIDKPASGGTMEGGPLITGIPSLGPGVRRVLTWGQYGGLYAALGNRVVTITARYEADRHTPWDPDEIVTESFVDVKSLETTSIADHNYDKVTSEQLKTIASTLEQVTSGWRTLKVEIQSSRREEQPESDSSAPAS
jgi:hypothetical protein